jgi:hypothetical protein
VIRGLGCCDGLSLGWGAQRTERTKGTSRALTLEGKRRQAGRRRIAMAAGSVRKGRRRSGVEEVTVRGRGDASRRPGAHGGAGSGRRLTKTANRGRQRRA